MAYNVSGWKRQLPDNRDFRYEEVLRAAPAKAPTKSDLRDLISTIKDQGPLGSCTANGTTSVFEALQKKRTGSCTLGSRIEVYQNTRRLEGCYPGDNGGTIRGAVKSTAVYGVAPESLWPYDVSKFDVLIPDNVAQAATKYESTNYYLLDSLHGAAQTLTNIKHVLGVVGLPVVFGTPVYAQIRSVGSNGLITFPGKHEASIGGHCMAFFGHDDDLGCFLTLNSWSKKWAMAGLAWLPYMYILKKLVCDCWCVAGETELSNA